MTAGSHQFSRDDLAAYALGSLETAEASELERHLAECPECREYLAWLDPAVDLIPASVEQHQPPPRLKRALMADVRDDVKATRRAERRQRGRFAGFPGFGLRPVVAAAACFVLVAGLAAGYALRSDDADRVVVEAVPLEGGAPLAATLEREGDRGLLHVESLPPLPGSRVYQAWIERDGVMEPSTTFVVDRDGGGEVAIDGSLDGAAGVYVTREPRGGSETPSLPPLLKAPIS